MATLESARQKWERKTANAGEKWKAATLGKEDAWCRGVAQFLGTGTCDPAARQRFAQGVSAITAADFQARIAGKGDKWAENFRRALGG